ncbi:hypothetical protein ABZ801_35325 [Actinomadura sp. NPDC047616]|uniref:hypothetical protein n=1 Tax=Actinomadura sp. NPDC047616 TaxID=3155914 RepID=UPI00340F3389
MVLVAADSQAGRANALLVAYPAKLVATALKKSAAGGPRHIRRPLSRFRQAGQWDAQPVPEHNPAE